MRAQHGGSRVIAFDQREQQMLGAQVAVSEPDRVLEPAAEDRPGAGRHSLNGPAVDAAGPRMLDRTSGRTWQISWRQLMLTQCEPST